MATGILVSEEEYLHTSYEPDCEYNDGILEDRNLGTWNHAQMQGLLTAFFVVRRKEWRIKVGPEARFRTRNRRYMIPDIAVLREDDPTDDIVAVPPLIWIEILSPEDRYSRVIKKVNEVRAFGAPYVWVVDPITLESVLHTKEGPTTLEDRALRIPNTPIIVPLDEL